MNKLKTIELDIAETIASVVLDPFKSLQEEIRIKINEHGLDESIKYEDLNEMIAEVVLEIEAGLSSVALERKIRIDRDNKIEKERKENDIHK